MTTTLSCQKECFNLDPTITYLNGAYMSPLLKVVEAAGIKGMQKKRTPSTIKGSDFFEIVAALRYAFAQLVNIKNPNRIVVIPSVSYGIATAAQNAALEKGDTIVIVSEQFPSNYYAWEKMARTVGAKVKIVQPPVSMENRGKIWNERILEAIDSRTKVITLGQIHWADGTLFDLQAIRERSKSVGALMIIDGTQSVGAMPFDVQMIQPDALICGGYKWLLGPYSIGLAYFGEAFDGGQPIEESWVNRKNSEDFRNLVNYQAQYQPDALRYQVGEASNFILAPMLLAAIETLIDWQPARIQVYCQQLVCEPLQMLQNQGFIIENPNYRSSHLFGIRLPKTINIEAVKARFTKDNIVVSFRGDAIRVSPNVYNNETDMERFLTSFKRL